MFNLDDNSVPADGLRPLGATKTHTGAVLTQFELGICQIGHLEVLDHCGLMTP